MLRSMVPDARFSPPSQHKAHDALSGGLFLALLLRELAALQALLSAHSRLSYLSDWLSCIHAVDALHFRSKAAGVG